MTIAERYVAQQSGGYRGPSGLADVLDVLLDKGLVIDAFVRVSLVGIELLTIDARIVVAGVDTYLRFAEAVNRLDLLQRTNTETLGEAFGGGSRRDRSGSNGQGRGRSGEDGEARQDGGRRERPQEIQNRDRGQEGEQQEGQDRGEEDSGESSDEDKGGLLSRLKERGQAF